MTFDNGDACSSDLLRSIIVALVCGTEERLTDVAEPAKCAYTAKLTTPAACQPVPPEASQPTLEHDEL